MRTIRSAFWCTLTFLLLNISSWAQSLPAMQLVQVPPCRLVDTRQSGGPIQGGTSQNFGLIQLAQAKECQNLSAATAYSLNVTVVPHGYLGYLTIWPQGQTRPTISLMNSFDGRIKANAAVVVGGTSGGVSVYVTNTADVILDIDGYFEPASLTSLQYYPLTTPCRVADTRQSGGPLPAGTETDFNVLASSCVPSGVMPTAYSLNFTAVPNPAQQPLYYLTVWPTGLTRPTVSTLNNVTGTIVANAAIVPATGTGGEIAVYPSNTTDLVIDMDGYFAGLSPQGLLFNTLGPCRAFDTRQGGGAFTGQMVFDIETSPCAPPSDAAGYVMNATVIPQGDLGYLTLWPDGLSKPLASTLNAMDGAVTSNMAIVATSNGSIDAYAAGTTNLLLDLSGYLATLQSLTITTTTLPNGATGQRYTYQLTGTGGEQPYTWAITSGTLPTGLTLSSNGALTGIPLQNGVFPFTVQVTDAFNDTASANLSLTVAIGPLVVLTTALPNGTQNVPYSATLLAAGGFPPYTWSLTAGALPDGLTLDPSSGTISGTPTTIGIQNFTVQAADTHSDYAQKALAITVNNQTTNGSLSGKYAFSFNGYQNGSPYYMAGSFIADGNGNITSGILDLNNGTGSLQAGYTLTGTYTLGANALGTMQFSVPSLNETFNFSFTVSTQGNGQLIQQNTDPNPRGSGAFFVQSSTAFQVPHVGTYGIGSFGADATMNRYAKAGVFAVQVPGSATNGVEDDNDNGVMTNRTFTGTFYPPNVSTGRGQVAFSFPNGVTNNYSYYVVSNGQFIIIGTDPLDAEDPLTLGTILTQVTQSFNNSWLNGNSIYETNGLDPNGGSPVSDAQLGIIGWNGNAGTANLDENDGGRLSRHTLQGTYTVATNGRVAVTGLGATPPILYLINLNQAFVVGQDTFVSSGVLESQTATPPYGNQSILGNYLGGTVTPVDSVITDVVNSLSADGAGDINGVQERCGPTGCDPQPVPFTATYQVDSTGRAVMTENGSTVGYFYVVAAKKFVLIPTGANPVLSTLVSGLIN